MRRAFAVVAVVALVLTAAAAAATRVRWHGKVGQYGGAGVGMPIQVGRPFSVGMGDLQAHNGRVRIESVRPFGADPGLVLIGALTHGPGHGSIGADRAFPPTIMKLPAVRPLVGAVVPAHGSLPVVVGLRATKLGSFRMRGLEVTYSERWHGVDLRLRARFGFEVDVCSQRGPTGLNDRMCAPPRPLY